MTSDRAKMCLQFQVLQWCWSHLSRDFHAISEAPGKADELGQKLVDLTAELFHHWHRVRDGTQSRETFQRHVGRLRKQFHETFEVGTQCSHARTRGTCRELLKRTEALWTFVDIEGVEPTNNAAERALRFFVIWRKLSFGTQSERASQFVETMLTVLQTRRQQGRNAVEYLMTAITFVLSGQPAPSLASGL